MIDQKVGLKNYQHYLTSVAHTGGSGRPAKLKYKNIQFWGKIAATGCSVIALIKTSSFSFFQFPKIDQVSTENKTQPRVISTSWEILTGWLACLYLAGNSN